jgi:HNH endonuclease
MQLARVERLLAGVLLEARHLASVLEGAPAPRRAPRPRRRRYFPHRRWTAAEAREAVRRYPHEPTKVLAERFGRPMYQVYQFAARHGLSKTAEYLASPAASRLRRGDNVGAPYRFPKGHVPHNKGLRRPGWFRGRMRETWFKRGALPHTWVPVGTEVLDPDGYRKRKVTDNRKLASRFNWKFVHVLTWEKAHGPVPRGHAVAFRNGDRRDIRLENLELVSRRELMRRNTVHNLPKPLAQVIQLHGALTRQIRRRTA